MVLGLMELWEFVPQCMPGGLVGPKYINEIRRGLECTYLLLYGWGRKDVISQ